MGDWLGIGIGAAQGAAGTIVNEALAGRQQNRQKELMDIQNKNQSKLNKEGREGQLKMWKDTNYPAQIGMMKEAGLSPGLIYGGNGAGGATTGSQGGGAAAGGQAAKAEGGKIMGIEGMIAEAQIENMKADARKKNVEADKLEGVDTDKGRQEILTGESIASLNKIKEGNIQSDTELKVEQTRVAKALANSEEFKTEILKLEKERAEKGFIKGDTVGNVISGMLGLDPTNPNDAMIVKGIVGAMLGSQIIGNLSGAIGKILGGFAKGKSTPKIKGGRTNKQSAGEWDGVITD